MEPIEVRSDIRTKFFAASPTQVFAAIRDSTCIAKWWGPDGFTNTIHTYDFVPGGSWRLTMHGPDGTDYPTEHRFIRIVQDQIFEIEHLNGHHFILTLELQSHGNGTNVLWRQTFDTAAQYKSLAAFIAAANEQNLGRLALELTRNKNVV